MQSLSAARPVITVYNDKGETSGSTCALPAVYKAPIRPDIVSMIHHEIAKNRRQPYAVNVDSGRHRTAEPYFSLHLRMSSAALSPTVLAAES